MVNVGLEPGSRAALLSRRDFPLHPIEEAHIKKASNGYAKPHYALVPYYALLDIIPRSSAIAQDQ